MNMILRKTEDKSLPQESDGFEELESSEEISFPAHAILAVESPSNSGNSAKIAQKIA